MASEFIVTLIILGILGIFISGYLIKNRVTQNPTVCPIGGSCEKVLKSKWNRIFGINNDLFGFFYYLLILILAFYLIFFQQELPLFATFIALGAFVFSIFLVFIQAKMIKEYCFYCLISAGINLLILINVLVL